jgi:phosphatidylserine/phosphatidylglycerophosphate/cardiolipin synthase-like enzyme
VLSTVLLVVLLADGGLIDGGADAGRADAGVKLGPCKETQEICFSPDGGCDLRVAAMIDRSRTSLDVAIYSINRISIVDAILRVKARGVSVRVVVDSTQLGEDRERAQLLRLLAAHVPIKRDTHQGSMHMKVVVRDNQEFLVGSYNFTNNATDNNDESVLFWDCPRNATAYSLKFESMWFRYKDASDAILKLPGDGGRLDGGS